MQDMDRTEAIVGKFVCMTLQEFKNIQLKDRRFADYFSDTIIEEEMLEKEKAKSMEYMDIICLIDNISYTTGYDFWTKNGEKVSLADVQYYHCRMLLVFLQDAYKNSIPIKLFLSLPVKTFYKYLETVICDKRLETEFQQMREQCSGLRDGVDYDSATIKDILEVSSSMFYRSWSPMLTTLEGYRNQMMRAYELAKRILVDSFKLTFPERFHAKDVHSKYRDEWQDAEDEFFVFD